MKKLGKSALIVIFFLFMLVGINPVLAEEDSGTLTKITDSGKDYINALVSIGDTAYFVKNTEETGSEIWKTDGTAAGTALVKDINPGTASSTYTYHLFAMNNNVYFFADDGVHGRELWKTDGTEAGTVLVKDINPGLADSSWEDAMTLMNNVLYFFADDGIHGNEFWRTDGTEAGTWILKDVQLGPDESSLPNTGRQQIFVFNTKLYFFNVNYDNMTYHLFRSNGISAGAKEIYEFSNGPLAYGNEEPYMVFNNKVYFLVYNDSYSADLWETDGTRAGTKIIQDDVDKGLNSHSNFTIYDNKLYFTASDADFIGGVYSLDTNNTITKVVNNVYITSMISYNDKLYLSSGGGILWKTDGTVGNMEQVKDLNEGTNRGTLYGLKKYNNKLYVLKIMLGNNTGQSYYNEIWESDGTEEGTVVISSHLAYQTYFYVTKAGIYFLKANNYHMDEGYEDKYWNQDIDLMVYRTSIPITYYTVIFKDYDNTILKESLVAEETTAEVPVTPKRAGYTFMGWDKVFDSVTSDMIIKATYKKNPKTIFNPVVEPTLKIENVTKSIKQEKAESYNFIIKQSDGKKELIDLYDINLVLDGQNVQPDGTLQIKIEMTDKQKQYDNLQVIYIDDNGNLTVMPTTVEGNYIVFTVTHLSNYAVIGEKIDTLDATTTAVDTSVEKPANTENSNNYNLIIWGASLVLVGTFIILIVKKKTKK